MFKVLHRGTGHVAFLYDHIPHPHGVMEAEHATYPNGTRPQNGDYIFCGTCGEHLEPSQLVIPESRHYLN